MKVWKKLTALGLTLAMTLSLAACGQKENVEEQKPAEQPPVEDTAVNQEETPVRVVALKGPTGMGMAYLAQNEDGETEDDYDLTIAAAPTDVPPLMIQGKIDMACVPANMASVLYQKMETNLVTLAVNTLGVLYVVENGDTVQSMADLKGKTIVASGKGLTPEYTLRYLLTKNGIDPDKDVTIEWKNEHSECVAALASGAATIAMLPQPFVTVAQSKIEGLRMALDLNDAWENLNDGSQLVTGVVVARRDFVEQNPEAVADFLEDYAESVEKVNADPAAAGARIGELDIVAAPVAEKAIPYCNIVCITGSAMKDALSGYLQVLFDAAPESVGGALPADDFYFGA